MTAPTTDLERVHAVTDNFFFWQGLRWVPLGAALVLTTLMLSPAMPLPPWARNVGPYAILAAAFGASVAIGRYYRRTFGHVRGTPGAHTRRTRVKWLVVYPLMGASLIVDALLRPPLFTTGLVWGLGVIAYWYSTGRGREHYVAFAIAYVALTFAPLAGVANGIMLINAFVALLGVTYMIGGVLDHLALRRILAPAPVER